MAMQAIKQQLESVFRQIEQQRMRDMPMCNPALQVEAIGFREWGEYTLGVMLTPWFMNLMLLPASDATVEALAASRVGSKQLHLFPSGRYEFVNANEAGLGHYQVCSLFSPLLEFADQQIVVDIARAALDELMQTENRDEISTHEKVIEKRWHEESATEPDAVADVADHKTVDERLESPLSRRDFLRGRRASPEEIGHGD